MNDDNPNADSEQAFIAKAKALLDSSEHDIDRDTLVRLNEIRQQALHPESTSGRGWRWRGAASVVTAMVVAVLWGGSAWWSKPTIGLPSADPAAQMTQGLPGEALSDEDIALLEDIEFVAWLMEQDDVNAG